jgi:hypothetical protein
MRLTADLPVDLSLPCAYMKMLMAMQARGYVDSPLTGKSMVVEVAMLIKTQRRVTLVTRSEGEPPQ